MHMVDLTDKKYIIVQKIYNNSGTEEMFLFEAQPVFRSMEWMVISHGMQSRPA